MRRFASSIALLSLVAGGLSCKQGPPPLPQGTPTPITYFTSQRTDTRFRTADHFQASIEMQITGEPFAELLGRDLTAYDRTFPTPDLYYDAEIQRTIIDPLGFSTGIESYEYSKQPMNNTSFESGAGLSLKYGPLLNPTGVTGDAAFVLLRDRLQSFAVSSSTDGAGTNWVVSPAPTDNPFNHYGWPGFWPVFAEFRSFAPEITPLGGATRSCSFVFGYAASGAGAQKVGDYECGYTSLNLPRRDEQVEKVLEPAALGFALWKQVLWVINYWQSLHDTAGNPISEVDDVDLPLVGKPNNLVIGHYPDPADPSGEALLPGVAGTYLGDIPLEGFQGLTMIDEMDNKSAMLLRRLLTSDGSTLGGFASTKEALDYHYKSPLRWWPSAIAVVETGAAPGPGESWKHFPRPTAFTVAGASSKLRGLSALAGGFAFLFAFTDGANPDVGGTLGPRTTFDGDPFPGDNGLPDGEESPHDRALANVKVALVNMDRLHFDPAAAVLVDEATVSGGTITRGKTVSTVDAAYAIVGLRSALRSISRTLTLYSNDTPDVLGGPTILDTVPLDGAPAPLPARLVQLIRAEADFIVAKLVASDGAVANSYDLAAGQPDAAPTKIEAEASAIRGLLEAYLATSDAKYRQAAQRVYADLERRFWIADVRAFRTTAGDDNTFTWTPIAFGTLQGALRQFWKALGTMPGNERAGAETLERLMRLNKLVLNGWDDANADNRVQYPGECTGAGLQMAERALTGEPSHISDRGDRDKDCVPEVSVAKLPAALASQVVFQRR